MRSLRGHPHTLWIGVMAAGLVLGSTLPVWAATGLSYTGEHPIYKTVTKVVPRYKTKTVRVPKYAKKTVQEPLYTEETTVKPDGQTKETQVQIGTEPVSENVVVGYTHKTKKVRDGTKTTEVRKIVGYRTRSVKTKTSVQNAEATTTLNDLAYQANQAAGEGPSPAVYVSTSNYETALAESEGLQVVQVGGSGAKAARKIANAQVLDGASSVVILGGSQARNVNTEVLAQNLAAQHIADGDAVGAGPIVQIGGNDVYDTLAGAVTYNALAAQAGGDLTLNANTLNTIAAAMENEDFDNSRNQNTANFSGVHDSQYSSQISGSTAGEAVVDLPTNSFSQPTTSGSTGSGSTGSGSTGSGSTGSGATGSGSTGSGSTGSGSGSGSTGSGSTGSGSGSGSIGSGSTGSGSGSGSIGSGSTGSGSGSGSTPPASTTGLLAVTPYTGDPGTAVALTGTAMDNDATNNLGNATWYNLSTGLFYATPLTMVSAGTDYTTTVPEAPAGTYGITVPNTQGTVGFALTAPSSGTTNNPTVNTVTLTAVAPSTGADGITVTLTATVTGTPPTTVTWLNATTGQTATSVATESNATTYTTVVPTLPDGNYAITLGNSNSIAFTVVTACSTAHPGYLENDGTLTPAFTQCDTLVIPLTSENNTGAALALQSPPPAVTPVAPSAATALIAQGSPVQCRKVRTSWWPTWFDWVMGPQHTKEQCEIVRHDPWQTPEQNTPY